MKEEEKTETDTKEYHVLLPLSCQTGQTHPDNETLHQGVSRSAHFPPSSSRECLA